LVRQFSVPKLTRDSETMLNNPLDRGAEYKKLTNKKVITWSDVKNVEKLATGGHSCICTGTLDGEPVVVKVGNITLFMIKKITRSVHTMSN